MSKTMTRREALKTLGLAFGTAAVGLSGAAGLTSCSSEKKRIVFYFTATGNSLFVARELGGENIISIPQALKNDKLEYEADEIGIVYPIYGHMPPNIVKDFLKAARLKADYFFAVLTYGNNRGASPEVWDEFATSCGYKFNYITTVLMVDNWLHAFDMNEQMKIDKKIPEQLERIHADLAAHVN
ncbi:MAG: flavodoxin family protein, partial [Bacteroidales bacterium]|nr:flavodoxin family protein [Bacteroidales bacterium]